MSEGSTSAGEIAERIVMSQGTRISLGKAKTLGEQLVAELESSCEKIMIAGSVRREKETIGDLEIVAMPREHDAKDLFGESVDTGRTYLDVALEQLHEVVLLGWTLDKRKQGKKLKKLRHTSTGFLCDLFIVTEKRAWGSHVAVRTGPHPFSIHMMKRAKELKMFFADGFLLHNHLPQGKNYCPDGVNCNRIIPLPNEADVFEALKINYMYPREREERYGVG